MNLGYPSAPEARSTGLRVLSDVRVSHFGSTKWQRT